MNPFSHPSQYTFSNASYVGTELLAPHELFIAPAACTAALSRMTAMKAALVRCLVMTDTADGLRHSFELKLECKWDAARDVRPAKRARQESVRAHAHIHAHTHAHPHARTHAPTHAHMRARTCRRQAFLVA